MTTLFWYRAADWKEEGGHQQNATTPPRPVSRRGNYKLFIHKTHTSAAQGNATRASRDAREREECRSAAGGAERVQRYSGLKSKDAEWMRRDWMRTVFTGEIQRERKEGAASRSDRSKVGMRTRGRDERTGRTLF